MSRTVALWGVLACLCIASVALWGAVVTLSRPSDLTVTFLNVGQGDAIFIQSPTRRQVLVDGGRDRAVLRELGAVMPWWDRSIDVVVATHPDADHVGGLFDVLARYGVQTIFQSGVQNDTPQTESLLSAVSRERSNGAQELLARRGQRIDIGGGAYIEMLFPDRDVSGLETNTASIVMRVVYGETAFLLNGDSPKSIEEYLVQLDGTHLQANVLKAGHHGSDTSSAVSFVGHVSPEWVVFSRGCNNTYGHPHKEVVDLMKRFEIATKDTCLDGRVSFVSDGKTVLAK
ncbi:MAG: MBL fold metallo-hydrolase [Candidatus Pacebacteria bacterium]|nr:MBL fold metallo-hydrolase [Candidatus Paceibacterota bacterium]